MQSAETRIEAEQETQHGTHPFRCTWPQIAFRAVNRGDLQVEVGLPPLYRIPKIRTAARPGATIVAQATGTIILAIDAIYELWCRPQRHGPKVLRGAGGSCLPQTCDFAHKIPHLIMRRAG